MMNRALTPDQTLRQEALRLATTLAIPQAQKAAAAIGTSREGVLQTAKQFYLFMRGEEPEGGAA